MAMPPTLWPKEPFRPWKLVFNLSDIAKSVLPQPLSRYFLNSVIMTFGTMLLSIPVTSMAAYAVSKLLKGRTANNLFVFLLGR